MNLPHNICKNLGKPIRIENPPDKCRSILGTKNFLDTRTTTLFQHDFTHIHAHRITSQYRVQNTLPEKYIIVQSTYCNHRGCSARQQITWEIDEPFDWNTNPPILEDSQ